MNAVTAMAENYDVPVIYSTHPRSKKFFPPRLKSDETIELMAIGLLNNLFKLKKVMSIILLRNRLEVQNNRNQD